MALSKEHREIARCYKQPGYFLSTYARIYDATRREWIPFDLWPAQVDALATLQQQRQTVILKARQLGLSWLTLGYALWLMLFHPAAAVLFFSRRDEEAKYMLSDERLRGMFTRLPEWLRSGIAATTSGAHEWTLSNGSSARAFPTTGGRSYTATLAVVDEADFCDDLDALLNAVKPTIDAGGALVLLSTADKSKPLSPFKRIYRAAQAGQNDYAPIFLPWSARPDRTPAWYAQQRRDVFARTGSYDDCDQEYPATDTEALQGRSLDKRFPAPWLDACKAVRNPLVDSFMSMPGLAVYALPDKDRAYVIGADPAEGNPQSDESAACVLDVGTGAQVAVMAGKFDPAIFGSYVESLANWYNRAPVMVERNNHGHAVLLWLKEFGSVQVYAGLDGRPGWMTTGNSKPLLIDNAAAMLRDRQTNITDAATHMQLAMLDGTTLRAPEGDHDDRAMAYMLALAALRWRGALPDSRPGYDPFATGETRQRTGSMDLVPTESGVRFQWRDRQPGGTGLTFR